MLSHILRRFVERIPAVDLLQMSLKIKTVSALHGSELFFQLSRFGITCILQKIIKAQLLFIFCRKVINPRADQTDRTLLHLLKKLYRFLVDLYCRIARSCRLGAGNAFHIRIGDLEGDALSVQSVPLCPMLHTQREQKEHIH